MIEPVFPSLDGLSMSDAMEKLAEYMRERGKWWRSICRDPSATVKARAAECERLSVEFFGESARLAPHAEVSHG